MEENMGNTIAFVLAVGEEPGDIGHAIGAARAAGVAAAIVLARPEFTGAALDAVRLARGGKHVVVQAVEYDPAAAIDLTRDAGDFELFSQLPFGLLETMRVIAESLTDTYDSILVLDSRQTRIESEHLLKLRSGLAGSPEVVVSWIDQLRRMPCLVTRAFLERLERRDPELCAGAGKAVPRIGVHDCVFDEAGLAAPNAGALPARVEAFLEKCTMTAPEAVAGAREANSNADALLIEAARQVGAQGDADAEAAGDAAELAWADEFGRRNRRDFPLLNDEAHAGRLAYLDTAATSQRCSAALEAQRAFDEHANANVYRGAYELSGESTIAFNDARARLARFIGADPGEIAFTANATAGVNLVALAWGERNIGRDDLIVCELAAHHANLLPFVMLAQRKGARVECVPYDAAGRLDRAAYRALLDQRPKLVCFAQVGNVLGVEAPVAELAAEAHATGARVLVDAAQSFPHERIDAPALGADWLTFSAHKAYAPMGVGALWIADAVYDEMDPVAGGGGVVTHVAIDSYRLRAGGPRFEPGTPPVSQAIAWAAALDYLDGLGMDNVARHAAALTRHAVRGLQRIDGVNVVGDRSRPDGQCGIVPFTVRSVAPGSIARFLGRLGVCVRSGGHCALPLHAALGQIGTGRLSVGVHTTRADVDAALVAVGLCRRAFES